MRVFFDTEFLEDGITVDLISIGLVRDYDYKTLYLVNRDCNWSRVYNDPWLCNNVVPKLPPVNNFDYESKNRIATLVNRFCTVGGMCKPEFWAYYASYDWVALCQLYGKMLDIPDSFPKYCKDFKQYVDERKIILPKPSDDKAHNALDDAKWLASMYSRFVLKESADLKFRTWC